MTSRADRFAGGAYSQHGEEGVIAAILRVIDVRSRTCVEFGAYDLERFSNVHSLWSERGWRALLIEGDARRFGRLRRQHARLPPDVRDRVRIANRFVAPAGPDRLDAILEEHGLPRDLDLLSIDVDGMDYHLWSSLERHRPRLVVIEYNASIPPHIELVGARTGNNVGSSALAVQRLGAEKGYSLVACLGWNAFFVEREHADLFESADDLEALFDARHIRYAMQSIPGEVFFDAPLFIPYWPMFRRDSDAIEHSSAPLWRFRPTVASLAEVAARHYLRPVRARYRALRGRD